MWTSRVDPRFDIDAESHNEAQALSVEPFSVQRE